MKEGHAGASRSIDSYSENIPTYLYSYLLPLCGSLIVKVFPSLLLFFSFACVYTLFRSSFSILPRGPARPVRRSSSPLTRGYLTLIQPWNVRTARHVIYPIVNFPNIITSLGIIRIPSGLVIVERRLGRGSLLVSRCFRFSASMMQTVRKILYRCSYRIVRYRSQPPSRYLSRRGAARRAERGSIRSYNSLFGIRERGGGNSSRVH